MAPSAIILSVIVMTAILASGAATKVLNPVHSDAQMAEFIRTSCNVTLYPQVCVSSLSSYAGPLKPKQSDLVNAAVQVSLVNTHNVSVWAAGLKTRRATMSKREKAALKDCMENFGTTMDQIHQSLAELKHLRRNTFKIQMSNVETWMSAALTNEDSCLDGFQVAKGRVKAMVTGRVHYLSKLISNALALVNTFAATGGH
jgi:pectinesterase inhibitor-like protein|uniref:pectinesterase n=1 Tax=Picea sitchensis TaxID=3332 RepID=A9NQ46_PICSI|nr:unknown [Picea sitchensis]